jgi:putative methyltransferase (TIGR04325 family)
MSQALGYVYHRQFDLATGQIRWFRGIYPDFSIAMRDIPQSRLQGCDNQESVERVAHERLRICAFDYPIMFWLSKLLPDCRLLFDWGGSVGISYFGYRAYLSYPADLRWLVCDVSSVAALGEKIAADEAAQGLEFTTSLDRLCDADILLAAGSMHFIEDPFRLLREARALPTHVLINKAPLYDLGSAVTLHNMGSAICTYHLFNRREFIGKFEALGYQLIDEWASPDLSCEIPFFPEHSISAYTGFYFAKRAATVEGS